LVQYSWVDPTDTKEGVTRQSLSVTVTPTEFVMASCQVILYSNF